MTRLMADAVLALHLAFAAYIVFGLAAVWIGRALKRGFVHNPWFRLSHLAAMAVVAAEALLGVVCPLTRWEYTLRAASGQEGRYEEGFLHYWAQKVFYFDWSPQTFVWLYLGFFALMLATALLVPIRFKRRC